MGGPGGERAAGAALDVQNNLARTPRRKGNCGVCLGVRRWPGAWGQGTGMERQVARLAASLSLSPRFLPPHLISCHFQRQQKGDLGLDP